VIRDEYSLRCMLRSDIQQHLPRLHAEASIGDAQIIELGVRSGNSTVAFLAAVEEHGGHVYSADIDRPRFPWSNHEQWSFHHGNDLDLVDELPDQVDIVFIDTSHHFQQTVDELEVYVPRVKPGGVVLLHDTELHTPDGAPAGDPIYPVRAAVDLYCAEHRLRPEFVPGCNGLGVIRIPRGD
jgi:predicted O-methyltransferase YrrM